MGAFLGQVLAGDSDDEKFIQNYFAKNFPQFGGVSKSMLTLNEAIIDVKKG